MNNKPSFISVVVTAYNKEMYIGDCVDSILAQTYEPFECIVVDDGSQDGTKEVLRKYSHLVDVSRFRLIEAEHSGVSHARNLGIEAAQGDYITFTDGDDMLAPECLSHCAEILRANEAVDLLIFGIRVMDADNDKTLFNNSIPELCFENAGMLADWYIENGKLLLYSAANKLYRTDLLHRESILFPDKIQFGEDRLFNFEYLRHCGRIQTISECLYWYRKNSTGSSTDHFRAHEIENQIMLHRAKMECLNALSQNISDAHKHNFEINDRNAAVMTALRHLAKYREKLPEGTLLEELNCILNTVENLH